MSRKHGSEVICPNAPRKPCEEEKKYRSAEKYLLPPVVLWDPFVQYPNVFDDGLSCPHDSHAGEAREHLTAKKWKDGHSERDAPRKLYGRDNVVLLVSCVYVCPQGHELPAHHPRIRQHLTDKCIPFVLSHKGGVAIGFMDQVDQE